MRSMKKLLAALLALIMVISLLPMVSAADNATLTPADAGDVLTEADYAQVDALFAEINASEAKPAMKNATQAARSDAAFAAILASENYVEGSAKRNGDVITWQTTEGIACIYNPYMQEKKANMVAPESPMADGAYNEPTASKGLMPTGNQVYLVGPYYGYDSSFTDQYKNLAGKVANAIGDTDGYTLYSGSAATVDAVAAAVSNGAVVFFDSHGATDYTNGDDLVSGATSSYLCLNSSVGMTTADYYDGAYYGDGYAYVNGETISNHMTSNSPAGLVWMSMCLSMATDTLSTPLRNRGVEVVYGYSQSVTFGGEYRFSETFWDNMLAGNNVATSIAAMKSRWGQWDCSTEICNYYGWQSIPSEGFYVCATISDARNYYAAFPIVVSDVDVHPGQRYYSSNWGADSLQTVCSTYSVINKSTSDVGQSGMTTEEWQMLLLTNRERMNQGVNPLTSLAALQQVTDIRTSELAISLSHTRPNGTGWDTAITDVGITRYLSMGENVAGGYAGPAEVVAAWMNSEGHRKNILSTNFVHMGAGYESIANSYYGKYWSQFFYTDQTCNGYTSMKLDFPPTVNLSHTMDQMGITAVLTCGCGRTAYLPVSNEMTNYKQNYMGKQTVVVQCFGLTSSFTITPRVSAFTDIPSNAWYLDSVQYALDNGLMNGVGNYLFRPDAPMTRAQLVTVLWRFAGEPYGGAHNFTDVPYGQWYTDAVAWAAANGIVTGVGDGRFNPNGNVTREQLATILHRYATKLGLNVGARVDLWSFPDSGNVSPWALEAMQWCVAEGIIGGSNGKLMPQGNATRAQVAAILMRFIENVVKN